MKCDECLGTGKVQYRDSTTLTLRCPECKGRGETIEEPDYDGQEGADDDAT